MNKDDSEFIEMNLVGLREQFQSKHANFLTIVKILLYHSKNKPNTTKPVETSFVKDSAKRRLKKV